MMKFSKRIYNGAFVGCLITTAGFALRQQFKKTLASTDKIDVNKMESCPQPGGRHSVADVFATKEQAAENARLQRIRREMYEYGVSELHLSQEKATAAAEMAVRAAAGGRSA